MRGLFVVVFLLACSGCGTMSNLHGKEYALLSMPCVREPRIFGGVRNDVRWLGNSISYDTPQDIPPQLLGSAICIADLPLSAAADTITLPLVAHQRRNRSFAPFDEAAFPTDPDHSK